MNRRTLLARAGLATLGLGCARHAPAVVSSTPTLPKVRVSRDRVIDVTVGLRPYRSAGPRVEVQAFGSRRIIHNYGHGGAGMSLSWGTAREAAELVLAEPTTRVAVCGAGVVGLTTARQLQRRGVGVTLVTKALPPETTSNRSLATWTPTSGVVSSEHRTPEFADRFRVAARHAYLELQRLVGRGYGVSWIDTYELRQSPRTRRARVALAPSVPPRSLLPEEHPFASHAQVAVRPTLRIEPSIYLDALLRDVLAAGAEVVVRELQSLDDMLDLPEPTVVNCLGLAGGSFFDDPVIPVKGQLVRLVPQPEVNYGLSSIEADAGDLFFYMAPRADGIVLGGSAVPRDDTLVADDAVTDAILDVHARVMAHL